MSFLRSDEPSELLPPGSEASTGALVFSHTFLLEQNCLAISSLFKCGN